MSRRSDRVSDLIRTEISAMIQRELNDPRIAGVVSVTRVETSVDLRHARVFVSVLGDREELISVVRGLRAASGYLHRELRHRLVMKSIPELTFLPDESIAEAAQVLALMRDLSTPANG